MRRPIMTAALTTALLLLVPVIAMQFTNEVAWGPGDFVVAGLLVFGSLMAMSLGARHANTVAGKWGVIAAVTLGLAVTWAELAVGLFS